MRRFIALILCAVMVITGCVPTSSNDDSIAALESFQEQTSGELEPEDSLLATEDQEVSVKTVIESDPALVTKPSAASFSGMDDPELINYVEAAVYRDLVSELNSEDYFIENVEAVYISKEYVEEVTYNSQSNLYFGYTLAELDEQFQGKRYIFTVDENGKTTVKEVETLYDDSAEEIIKNVAVGGGVILMCVTVSSVSGVLGVPAISMIFAAGANTGTAFALSSGIISGAAAAITTGYQTQDLDQALEAAALSGSESFKWGAISGAILGGATTAVALHGATLNGLTMNEAAAIQKESGYPLDVIKEFHTMDEYQVFREANLKSTIVGNKSALIKSNIDLTKVDAKGRTNLERMRQGLAPQDPNGISYELHHVGQRKDGTLAILSQSEHDNPAIHGFLERTEAHAEGTNWDAERRAFWMAFAEMVG